MNLGLIVCYVCEYFLVGIFTLPFIAMGFLDDEDVFKYMLGILLVYPLVLVYCAVKQLTGLYRKLTGKKKKYTEYINVTVEEKDIENTKEDRMLETKKLSNFMQERGE